MLLIELVCAKTRSWTQAVNSREFAGVFCFLFCFFFFFFGFFFFFFWFVFLMLNLFWERERESEQGRGRERGRGRIPNRLHAVSTEPDVGFSPMNCEIMTWTTIKRHLTNWATQVPREFTLKGYFITSCRAGVPCDTPWVLWWQIRVHMVRGSEGSVQVNSRIREGYCKGWGRRWQGVGVSKWWMAVA